MFERWKDAFLYEQEFRKWLHRFNLPNRLVGNRVAEMHGLDPSYGQTYNVPLFRSLYEEKFPQYLNRGKKSGEPSGAAALRFLCDLLDAYAAADKRPCVREEFARDVQDATLSTGLELPLHWQRVVVDNYKRERRAKWEAEDARMPEILAARQVGRENCLRCSAELEAGAVPPGARSVWRALSLDFATEWEISQSSGLSLHAICTWLPVLVAKGLVVVIGTALKEPRYRKGLLEPKDEWTRALREARSGSRVGFLAAAVVEVRVA